MSILVRILINAVLALLTLPFFLVTLGLFTFVLKAFMLWGTAALSTALGLGFSVSGFGSAFSCGARGEHGQLRVVDSGLAADRRSPPALMVIAR